MSTEKIIVIRKKRLFESRYSVGIYVDGEFIVNTLKSNRQEIELPEGRHILEIRQANRSGQIEIDVKKGKVTSCVFSSTPLMHLTTLFLFLGLTFSYITTNGTGLIFYLLGILLTAYTFTKGRKTYFVFEEPTEDYSWINQ